MVFEVPVEAVVLLKVASRSLSGLVAVFFGILVLLLVLIEEVGISRDTE